MDHILDEIQNYIQYRIYKSQSYGELGISLLKGLILFGPPGCGKSSLMRQMAKLLQPVQFFMVESKEILSRLVGEGERKIENIFRMAKQEQPSVIVFDDIHILCGKKENSGLILTLSVEMEKIDKDDRIFVVGVTQELKQIDDSLQSAGQFEQDVRVDIPKASERLDILNKYLKKIPNSLTETDKQDINYQMNGFSGSDILSLLRESIMKCDLGFSDDQDSKQSKNAEEDQRKLSLQKKFIEQALQSIHPSGIKEILLEIPKVLWKDIGGYSSVKDQIKQVIEWPLKHPQAFDRMGITPSKGILLYGPPGCSKTMIAQAIATESKLNFLAVKGPELFSKYVGDSEKAIRELFRKARLCSPSVIFFDEIDAIATQRSINTDVSQRVLIQLLNQMDGIEGLKNVIIIAATNRPEIIDKALTRPGRFDHLIYVPPPDNEARKQIFSINIYGNKMPVVKDLEINKLSFLTNGFSGAEICLICREAGLSALSRDIKAETITQEDFDKAMKKVKPRITQDMLTKYCQFADNLKFF